MAQKLIKAYLCTGLRGKVRYIAPDEEETPDSTEKGKTVVRIEPYVRPVNCGAPPPDKKVGRFVVNLVRDPEPLQCDGDGCNFYESKPDPVINALWDTLPGESAIPAAFPEVVFHLPDHCAWVLTEVLCFGPPDYPGGKLLAHVTPAGGGPVPSPVDSYDKHNAFSGGVEERIQIIENLPVPGMQLVQRNYFNLRDRIIPSDAGYTYWCPPCLYGGKITAISGDPSDPATTYTVEVLANGGKFTSTVESSDFVEWEVGDWVFLVKKGGDVCGDQYRKVTTSLSANCSGQENVSDYKIVPMKIGEFGA